MNHDDVRLRRSGRKSAFILVAVIASSFLACGPKDDNKEAGPKGASKSAEADMGPSASGSDSPRPSTERPGQSEESEMGSATFFAPPFALPVDPIRKYTLEIEAGGPMPASGIPNVFVLKEGKTKVAHVVVRGVSSKKKQKILLTQKQLDALNDDEPLEVSLDPSTFKNDNQVNVTVSIPMVHPETNRAVRTSNITTLITLK